ncbi:Endonuclease [Balamuthia mandrillaris]
MDGDNRSTNNSNAGGSALVTKTKSYSAVVSGTTASASPLPSSSVVLPLVSLAPSVVSPASLPSAGATSTNDSVLNEVNPPQLISSEAFGGAIAPQQPSLSTNTARGGGGGRRRGGGRGGAYFHQQQRPHRSPYYPPQQFSPQPLHHARSSPAALPMGGGGAAAGLMSFPEEHFIPRGGRGGGRGGRGGGAKKSRGGHKYFHHNGNKYNNNHYYYQQQQQQYYSHSGVMLPPNNNVVVPSAQLPPPHAHAASFSSVEHHSPHFQPQTDFYHHQPPFHHNNSNNEQELAMMIQQQQQQYYHYSSQQQQPHFMPPYHDEQYGHYAPSNGGPSPSPSPPPPQHYAAAFAPHPLHPHHQMQPLDENGGGFLTEESAFPPLSSSARSPSPSSSSSSSSSSASSGGPYYAMVEGTVLGSAFIHAQREGGANVEGGWQYSGQMVPASPSSSSSRWTGLAPYRWDPEEEAWLPMEKKTRQQVNVETNEIRVATYNVLFDLYMKEHIHTEKRLPAIFDLLKNLDADIIALQEVTQIFLIQLLSQDWMKDRYLSDCDAGYTVTPYGQLLISKYPFYGLSMHKYSKYKKVIMGEFVINGELLYVPVIHLTSDRTLDPSTKRAQQVEVVFEKTLQDVKAGTGGEQQQTDCILLGDFNFGDGDENDIIRDDFKDVWLALRPSEKGYTFDVERNTTASKTTTTGKSRRFDRILVRSKTWQPCFVEMFGTEPIVWRSVIKRSQKRREEREEREMRMKRDRADGLLLDDEDGEVESVRKKMEDAKMKEEAEENKEEDGDEDEDVEVERVVFPSDHFGLKCVLRFS